MNTNERSNTTHGNDERNWGRILQVCLPSRRPPGHEQKGVRPCVSIADPSAVHPLRYPMLIVAPMTSKSLPQLPLYPCLEAGVGGLPLASTVLLDQLTAIDAHRVRGYIGSLSPEEFAPIREGLSHLFAFET